jgi:hypothetical protein
MSVHGLKIGVFVPAYRQVEHPGVGRQLALEERYAAEFGYELVQAWDDVNGIDMSRNRALELARENSLDYLYMQDNDNFSEWAVIPSLLETMLREGAGAERGPDARQPCAAVAAIYPLRRQGQVASVYPCRPGEIYEAERVATGMLLISIAAINAIAATYDGPWFRRSYTDRRETTVHEGGDVFFSRLLMEHDFRVWVDGTLKTHHATTHHLTFDPDPVETPTEATPATKRATTSDADSDGRNSDAGSRADTSATTAQMVEERA